MLALRSDVAYFQGSRRKNLLLDEEGIVLRVRIRKVERRVYRNNIEGTRRKPPPVRYGLDNETVGLAGSLVTVGTSLNGGLICSSVKLFNWFAL
jgi:hypothetical protein